MPDHLAVSQHGGANETAECHKGEPMKLHRPAQLAIYTRPTLPHWRLAISYAFCQYMPYVVLVDSHQ
eukprot:285747-Amphidinium_carterae.1